MPPKNTTFAIKLPSKKPTFANFSHTYTKGDSRYNTPMAANTEERTLRLRPIEKEDDKAMAQIVRANLKAHNLDIPGTAYFDPELDHLSKYYEISDQRAYYVLTQTIDGKEEILGGVGFGEFEGQPTWAEMQKLYLTDNAKGKGYGKMMVSEIEKKAKEAGYSHMYLETHSNLKAAIQLYHRLNYKRIERPEGVKHSTMDHFYIKTL